jgi:4-hydroxy-tetrahydrodipicolinate reductase
MRAIILGDGGMGRAIEAALRARGDDVTVLGEPPAGSVHPATAFAAADVAFEFSIGAAVLSNVSASLAAGCRRAVIGTTAWEADRGRVEELLRAANASAVAAASYSIGVALFGRLVEAATRLFGPYEQYDPFIVEWHRRTKADRPSGTAKELSRRLIAAHPRKQRPIQPQPGRAPDPDELEIAVVRAGASPGMHLVGFDAPGETLELRLTARDRSAYAAGALLSADWLLAGDRAPGLHSFDEVLAASAAASDGALP